MNHSHPPSTPALEGLKDIHLPDHISAWPPAFGWWLLILLILAGVIITILTIKKYRRKWGYRKIALRLLTQAYQSSNQPHESPVKCSDDSKVTTTVNTLRHPAHILMETLKRCAIAAYPDTSLSGLHGKEWIDFLNRQTQQSYFNDTLSTVILDQQYQANPNIDIEQLYHACQQWVRQHRTHVSPLIQPQQEEANRC